MALVSSLEMDSQKSFLLLRQTQNTRISELEGILNISGHLVQTLKYLVGG